MPKNSRPYFVDANNRKHAGNSRHNSIGYVILRASRRKLRLSKVYRKLRSRLEFESVWHMELI